MLWQLRDLVEHCNHVSTQIHGRWVPARPLHRSFQFLWHGSRFQAAWKVLRGRADAVVWPEGQ